MAFTIVNPLGGEPKRLSRGVPTPLGTLAAVNQAVAFSFSPSDASTQRNLVITTSGNLLGTDYLEFSLDGGTSWGAVPALTSDVAAAAGADTAAAKANRYNISGLCGAQFRYGITAFTSGSGAVTALVD